MVRFIAAETKDCPLGPGVSLMTRWPGSVSLWSMSGPGERKCPPGESGPRTELPPPWAPVVQHSLRSQGAPAPPHGHTPASARSHTAARPSPLRRERRKERARACCPDRALLRFHYITLGLERAGFFSN